MHRGNFIEGTFQHFHQTRQEAAELKLTRNIYNFSITYEKLLDYISILSNEFPLFGSNYVYLRIRCHFPTMSLPWQCLLTSTHRIIFPPWLCYHIPCSVIRISEKTRPFLSIKAIFPTASVCIVKYKYFHICTIAWRNLIYEINIEINWYRNNFSDERVNCLCTGCPKVQ